MSTHWWDSGGVCTFRGTCCGEGLAGVCSQLAGLFGLGPSGALPHYWEVGGGGGRSRSAGSERAARGRLAAELRAGAPWRPSPEPRERSPRRYQISPDGTGCCGGDGERWAGPRMVTPGDSWRLPAGSLAMLGIWKEFLDPRLCLQSPSYHHGTEGSFPKQYILVGALCIWVACLYLGTYRYSYIRKADT